MNNSFQEGKGSENLISEKTREKARMIIIREIQKEIDVKEQEIYEIQNRIVSLEKLLNEIRYAVVSNYYNNKVTKNSGNCDLKQSGIHPAVKLAAAKRRAIHKNNLGDQQTDKTVGLDKNTVENIESIRTREQLTLKSENINGNIIDSQPEINYPLKIPQDTTKERWKQLMIAVGNTSKCERYVDSHPIYKWLLYVRSKTSVPIENYVEKVAFYLHPTLSPDVIFVTSPPFQIMQEGWGVFPVKVVIYFKPHLKKNCIQVIYNLVINNIGSEQQTVGSETLLQTWIRNAENLSGENIASIFNSLEEYEKQYSPNENQFSNSEEMLVTMGNDIFNDHVGGEYVNETPLNENDSESNKEMLWSEDINAHSLEADLKVPVTNSSDLQNIEDDSLHQDIKQNFLEHFDLFDSTEINEMSYLMPVQENMRDPKDSANLNHFGEDNFQSKMINSISSFLKNYAVEHNYSRPVMKEAICKNITDNICEKLSRMKFADVQKAIKFLLREIPLISKKARDENFKMKFPFVVKSIEEYLKLPYNEQRKLQYTRAEAVLSYLKYCQISEAETVMWTIEEIVNFACISGYAPILPNMNSFDSTYPDNVQIQSIDKISNCKTLTSNEEIYNGTGNMQFIKDKDNQIVNVCDDSDEMDHEEYKNVLTRKLPTECETASMKNLHLLVDENLEYGAEYIHRMCKRLGFELRDHVFPGVQHSSALIVLIKSLHLFIQDLVNSAAFFRNNIILEGLSTDPTIQIADVKRAILSRNEFKFLTNKYSDNTDITIEDKTIN